MFRAFILGAIGGITLHIALYAVVNPGLAFFLTLTVLVGAAIGLAEYDNRSQW